MKRKILFYVTALALVVMMLPGCQKDDSIAFTEKNTFSVPVATAPVNEAAIAPATTTTLTWSATGGSADNWDVYYGESDDPELYQAGHNSQSISVPVVEGHTYHWYVATKDENGIETFSPVFSFSVKVTLNINNFVGTYDCDEPGYAHYDVHATKINATTIEIDNFWDSGFVLRYEFDDMGNVNIIPKTFPQSATVTYVVTGSGVYNNATGEFEVEYQVVRNTYTFKIEGNTVVTAVLDANTHTFVKK
jgi:hypothetical protein